MILAIAFGLVFVLADSNKTPDKGHKKKATPRPSVSINPYAFPLPQMGPGIKAIEKVTIFAGR
ncbi:MAG TPA: hypothetical protein VMC61_04685 [Methanocella sp.]|nr:hypothetical protein [Methanocella sp.]